MAIKKQIYISILLFFVLSCLLVLFFVYPLLNEIKKDSDNFVAEKNGALLLKNEFNQAQSFQKKYQEYQSNLQKIDQLFVDSQNPVDFIEYLEKTASDSGVKVQISTPSFTQDGSISSANFQLSVAGDFSKILKFVNGLETGQYLIKIQNLSASNTQATLLIEVLAK